jgi:hypothetical protein
MAIFTPITTFFPHYMHHLESISFKLHQLMPQLTIEQNSLPRGYGFSNNRLSNVVLQIRQGSQDLTLTISNYDTNTHLLFVFVHSRISIDLSKPFQRALPSQVWDRGCFYSCSLSGVNPTKLHGRVWSFTTRRAGWLKVPQWTTAFQRNHKLLATTIMSSKSLGSIFC